MNRFTWITCSLLVTLLAGCTSSREAGDSSYADQPSVVAVVDGTPLTLDEFEERYVRSVGSREKAETASMAEYEDFLERYVDFRLKVNAAREAGYHEDPELRQEIYDYRLNLGQPYLMEGEVLEPIIRDLYDKSQELIDVSHILVRVEPDASPEDTLAAYQRLAAVRDSVVQGADFAAMALAHSEDPSARMNDRMGFEGHLGYLGPGRVVQTFEDAMYQTPEGEVSTIFRSSFGYHILYVHDRRPAVPPRRVAHILIRPKADTDSARVAALGQIRQIQDALADGGDFAALAQEHSEDPGTRQKGGDLGTISFDSRLVQPFKEAAFALDSVGAVSDIVETQFGYHLIQLTEQQSLPAYEEAYDDLKKLAERLPRTQEAQQNIIHESFARRGARLDTALVREAFATVPPDTALRRLREGRLGTYSDSTFATIGDSSYALTDLSRFAASQQNPRGGTSSGHLVNLAERFMQDRALAYEAMALEETNPAFAAIMRDFREGLLLFRLMEDSVWTAAARDSAALRQHFESHRDTYRFPDRDRVVTFSSTSQPPLDSLKDQLDAGASLADLAAGVEADSTMEVWMDTTYLAGPTDSAYDRALELQPGEYTEPVPHQRRLILMVHDGIEPARLKTFEEARSEVASSYQDVLEDRLIDRLRSRYGVATYPERLARAFDGDATDAAGTTTAVE